MVAVGMAAVSFAENRQSRAASGTKPIVRLSVALMAIGEQDIQKIGNLPSDMGAGALQPTVVSNILYGLTHGNNPSNACVRTPLDIIKRSFAQSGITRISDTGFAFIESGSLEAVKFKNGGTLFVKVGENLQELEYGIEIKAKGGMVHDSKMNFDFDIFTVVPIYFGDEGYDYKADETKQKISCPIGQTTLVGGSCGLSNMNITPEGIRFFRSNPLLNWFLTDCGKAVSDRRLVIMICPEIVDGTQSMQTGGKGEILISVPRQDEAAHS